MVLQAMWVGSLGAICTGALQPRHGPTYEGITPQPLKINAKNCRHFLLKSYNGQTSNNMINSRSLHHDWKLKGLFPSNRFSMATSILTVYFL